MHKKAQSLSVAALIVFAQLAQFLLQFNRFFFIFVSRRECVRMGWQRAQRQHENENENAKAHPCSIKI